MGIMDNIRMRMAEKGMKGADMARAIGISTAAFSQWNKGKSIKFTEAFIRGHQGLC